MKYVPSIKRWIALAAEDKTDIEQDGQKILILDEGKNYIYFDNEWREI